MEAHDVPGWPAGVRPIIINGLGDLGVRDSTGEIFWKGQLMVTEKRFAGFERALAVVGLAIAFIGVVATVVQAWAAVVTLH